MPAAGAAGQARAVRQQQRPLLFDRIPGFSLASLTADWHVNADLDRFYYPLAFFVYGTYCVKLVPLLGWTEIAQNLVMLVGLVTVAVLSMLASPATYQRYSPPLRFLLLTYAYLMPVLTSQSAMQGFTPAPSTVPYLHFLIDAYSLWLSTRNAFLGWAIVGTRPALYVAVPYQLFAMWRVHRAKFCQSPVLQHEIMQDRTALAHFLLSFVSAGLAPPQLHVLVPKSPEQQCNALLLFYNIPFAFLVPLLLLVPLRRHDSSSRHQGSGSGTSSSGGGTELAGRRRSRGGSTLRSRLEQRIEGCLRMLMLPRHSGTNTAARAAATGVVAAQADAALWLQPPAAPHAHEPILMLVLRWWALVVLVWSTCCLIQG